MVNNGTGRGSSIYQIESDRYYKLLRESHSRIFSFDPMRIIAEKNKKRYFNGNVNEIKNLYTFLNLLKQMLGEKVKIAGIDYGCGSHYFVDDFRTRFGWDITGYDADKYAIEEAKKKYPENADNYIHLNLLLDTIPKADKTQDFVFCNAVIQHFSANETCFALKDISRVLKPNGVLLIIFKRNIDDWKDFSAKNDLKVEILDAREGKIKIEDKLMKEAISKLSREEKSKLREGDLDGLRLLHFFFIDEIIQYADQYGLIPLTNIVLKNKTIEKAVFTYISGKRIPTAAVFFRKADYKT